jgi:hypothetical protein
MVAVFAAAAPPMEATAASSTDHVVGTLTETPRLVVASAVIGRLSPTSRLMGEGVTWILSTGLTVILALPTGWDRPWIRTWTSVHPVAPALTYSWRARTVTV